MNLEDELRRRWIAPQDLGVGQVDPRKANVWLATVSYHVDTTGFEFPQFLNVVFGNSSIKDGLVVEDILPCPSMAKGKRRSTPGWRNSCSRRREVEGYRRVVQLGASL
jgi:hypothetical protein